MNEVTREELAEQLSSAHHMLNTIGINAEVEEAESLCFVLPGAKRNIVTPLNVEALVQRTEEIRVVLYRYMEEKDGY